MHHNNFLLFYQHQITEPIGIDFFKLFYTSCVILRQCVTLCWKSSALAPDCDVINYEEVFAVIVLEISVPAALQSLFSKTPPLNQRSPQLVIYL